MSAICDAFRCPPDVAVRQDWTLVRRIMDYRNAGVAVELFNAGGKAWGQMQKHPELGDLMLEMLSAQTGQAVTEADLERSMQAMVETEGDG